MSQLRSFLSSFKGTPSGPTPTEEEEEEDPMSSMHPLFKARSSNEYDDNSRSQWRDDGRRRSMMPTALVMPAARLAGPDGLHGLNSDSPPLTPASDEVKDSNIVDGYLPNLSYTSSLRHPWAAAQALADGTMPISPPPSVITPSSLSMTVSSIASGRSSPIILPPTSLTNTLLTSRPSSSNIAIITNSSSILPSHSISPSTSPIPPENATRAYWHASNTSFWTMLKSRLVLQFPTSRMPPLGPHLPALLFLFTAFVGSTMCILLALSTLPLTLPSHITDLTLSEIREMSLQLKTYSQSSSRAFAHTLAVLAAFFTWKQSFTIPGSLIMNVVFGAMYGTLMGTLYTSLLTSIGGVFCYLLVAPLGSLIRSLPGLNSVLEKMQRTMENNNVRIAPSSRSRLGKKGSNLWSYLLVLRVLPIVPYGLMNIACSVLRIPLLPYAVTLAIGSIPWNVCTVQVGDILVQVVSALDDTMSNSVDDSQEAGLGGVAGIPIKDQVKGKAQSAAKAIAAKIWNKEMIFKLILMSMVSLAPILLQRHLKKKREEATVLAEDQMINHSNVVDEISLAELDQEQAAVASLSLEDQHEMTRQHFLPAWISSNKSQHHHHHQPEASKSKRFSNIWTKEGSAQEKMAAANRTKRLEAEDVASNIPSIKRAVAPLRVQ